MSSYAVLRDVSFALRTLLWDAIKDDAIVNVFIQSEQAIGFADPAATVKAGGPSVSLWLYAVRVDEFRRNDPPVRSSDSEWEHPPLPLVVVLPDHAAGTERYPGGVAVDPWQRDADAVSQRDHCAQRPGGARV